MSLDIRRVREAPFKKLERPIKSQRWVAVLSALGAITDQGFDWLTLLAVFFLPAWLVDFGGLPGSGRVLVVLALLGGAVVLSLLGALFWGRPIKLRRALPAKAAMILLSLAVISAVFGLDPRASFGLTALGSAPLAVALIIGLAHFTIFINRPSAERLGPRVLEAYLLGAMLLALYTAVRWFSAGYEALGWVSRDSYLTIFAVNTVILTALAAGASRGRRIVWTIGLALQLFPLFLWDNAVAWVLVLIGTAALFAWSVVYAKKFWQSPVLYPLQVWILAVVLLFVPVKIFTGQNPPLEPAAYRASEVTTALARFGLPQLIFGVGAGASDLVMAELGLSFFDPDPAAGAALYLGEFPPAQPPAPAILDVYAASARPSQARLANSYFALGLEGGLAGALGWLAFLAMFIWLAVRGLGRKPEAATGLGALLLLAGLAVSAWSFPLFMVLIMFLGLTWLFYPGGDSGAVSALAWSRRWDNLPSPAKLWLIRALGVLLVISYIGMVWFQTRTVLAAASARAALATDAPGIAYNNWAKAVARNGGNDIYRVKLAESRWQSMTDGTPLPDQKEIIQNVNRTLSDIARTARSPVAHWLSGRLYAAMEPAAEGATVLGRESYRRALELWPGNMALVTELARLYRARSQALIGSDRSLADLQAEAKDRLQAALKLAPDYLPARLELAFISEKQSGIPAAVAELEPWEEASPEIRYHLGRLYFNDGDLAAARAEFLQVIKEVPNHSNAHYSLGVVYFREGKYKESLAEFEKVNELNPGSEDVKGKIEEVKKKVK